MTRLYRITLLVACAWAFVAGAGAARFFAYVGDGAPLGDLFGWASIVAAALFTVWAIQAEDK